MHLGDAIFFTHYSMSAMELAHALGGRGFESVWAPRASAYPAVAQDFVSGRQRPAQSILRRHGPVRDVAAASKVAKRIKFATGVLLAQQRDAIQTAKLGASISRMQYSDYQARRGRAFYEHACA